MDPHGLRKLHHLRLASPDLWLEGSSLCRFQDLLASLIDHLHIANAGPLQGQIIKTLHLAITKYPDRANRRVEEVASVLQISITWK
jgi:hypothetical protein